MRCIYLLGRRMFRISYYIESRDTSARLSFLYILLIEILRHSAPDYDSFKPGTRSCA